MFVTNFAVWFTFIFFAFCESIVVEDLPKCHLDDFECLRDLYEIVIRDICEHGIPELEIPPVDPMDLSNVTVNVLEMANITMVDGVAEGIKDCSFEKFSINITEGIGHQENTCNIVVKGHYIMEAFSPLFKNFLGEEHIHGDGNGKSETEKMHMTFDFPFFIQRRDDGEIYIKCIYDLIKYDYEIQGKVVFYADNIYVGDEEVNKQMMDMLNENWRFAMSAFGQPFVDKSVEFYFKFAGYFFDNVPARHYIIEDLSPYAKP